MVMFKCTSKILNTGAPFEHSNIVNLEFESSSLELK